MTPTALYCAACAASSRASISDDGQDWDWDQDWDDEEWDWDWDNEKWAEEEKRLAEEYAAHGVIKQDGKNYYYQGRPVYISSLPL